MPYRGGSLVDLLGRHVTRAPTRRMLRGVAASAGEEMTLRAARNTPKDTGDLARKWRSLSVEPTPAGGFESGTENPDYRALFIEHGVEPHEIEPKGRAGTPEAVTTPEGPRAGAEHPGHAGSHPLARAVAEVEAEMPTIAQPHLTDWAAEIERRAKRHKGVM